MLLSSALHCWLTLLFTMNCRSAIFTLLFAESPPSHSRKAKRSLKYPRIQLETLTVSLPLLSSIDFRSPQRRFHILPMVLSMRCVLFSQLLDRETRLRVSMQTAHTARNSRPARSINCLAHPPERMCPQHSNTTIHMYAVFMSSHELLLRCLYGQDTKQCAIKTLPKW